MKASFYAVEDNAMLSISDQRQNGPLRRREFLRIGTAAIGGLTLPSLIAVQANASLNHAYAIGRWGVVLNVLATIMHTRFDIGELRLLTNIPRDVASVITSGQPIRKLVG